MTRHKTRYPGVYYRIAKRIGGRGNEKVYYVKYRKDGKGIEAKVGRQYIDDMTPARANRIRADLMEGRRLTPQEKRALAKAESERWTVDRILGAYIESRGSDNTNHEQCRYNKYLMKPFGDKEPQEILPLDVDRIRLKQSKRLAPASVRAILELLNRLCNFAANKQLCPGLSFKIQYPKVNNEKTEDLSTEQLERLLKVLDIDPDRAAANMMKLALYSGMRRGEIFKLKWSDIDFEKGFILLRDPKGGKDEKIPLNELTRAILEDYPRTKGSPYVFPGRDGKQRTDARYGVNRIRKNAKLPKDFRPFHGLRHTYASMLASSGKVDMYTLQKLLTHKNPSMTARYAHLRDATLQKAAHVVDEIFTGTK